MNILEKKPIIYTAYSKHYFFTKGLISKFVLDKDKVPLNPFTNWDYFLNDTVNRDVIRRANNNLVYLANEIWCFGPIANGVLSEIRLAIKNNIKVKFFTIGSRINDIKEQKLENVIFEDELLETVSRETLLKELSHS